MNRLPSDLLENAACLTFLVAFLATTGRIYAEAIAAVAM